MKARVPEREAPAVDAGPVDMVTPASKGAFGVRAAEQVGRFALLILLIACLIGFSAVRPQSFGTLDNVFTILGGQAEVVLLALAITIPLMAGSFDFSAGAVVSTTTVALLGLLADSHLEPALAVAAVVGLALLIGVVNAFLVTVVRIHSLVATLGTATVLSSFWTWYLGPHSGLIVIPPAAASFEALARGSLAGVPLPLIYIAVVVLALELVLHLAPVGRRLYVAGANPRAARLSGIRTERYVFASFVAAAVLAGVAGVMLAARHGTATPGDGDPLLFPAFTAAFLGATTIRPGRFNPTGTAIAAFALAVFVAGLIAVGASPYLQPVLNGGALIVAVALSAWSGTLRISQARREQLRALRRRAAA